MSHKKILVIKLGALGDFIQATGAMAAIREYHKNAHITLLTTKPFEDLAKDSGYFNEIWIDKKPKAFNISEWLSLKNKLNAGKFDRVYDLQNNDRTSFYFKLFSPKPEWSGAVKGASHQNSAPSRTAGHAFDGHIETLKIAGIENISIDTLDWMDDDISDIKPDKPYVLLVPGCALGREEKRWPVKYYVKLAHYFIKKGVKPVILGTDHEKEIAECLEKETNNKVLNLISRTSLKQIVTLARSAEMTIGNDTGPMHLIAATGCKTLTLFSSNSDPVRHAPKGKNTSTIQKDNLENLSVENVIKEIENMSNIKAEKLASFTD